MSTRADAKAPPGAEPAPARATLTTPRGFTLQRRCACGNDAGGNASCQSCATAEPALQRRGDGSHGGGIPSSVHHTLAQPGRPLDGGTRSFMESRFGEDFSGVRIHDDHAAAQSARDVHAHAYTVGENIVFAPGQFQPHSEGGRHLLAHELAHTVQQRGLQRSGVSSLADQGPEYRRLEAEADRAADFALSGAVALSGHGLRAASAPMLSRTPDEDGAPLAATGTAPGSPQTLTVTNARMTTVHRVTPAGGFNRTGATLQAFGVDKLYVPNSKGPHALPKYQSIAGGALQATLLVESRTRAIQWQERPSTSDLRSRWLQMVNWQPADANTRWQAAGGDSEFPKVNNATCQMDHIVELQVGGNNVNENIQALDGPQNGDSGGALAQQVFGLAESIQADRRLTDGSASQIQLRFGAVQMARTSNFATVEAVPTATPPASRTCLSVEYCARRAGAPGAAAASAAAPLDDYEISAGGAQTTLRVPAGFSTTPAAPPVTISGDSTNESASTLISGLTLTRLRHVAGGGDRIDAAIDTSSRTRLPLTMTGESRPVEFTLTPSGSVRTMRLATRRPNLTFNYPYLSPGTITSLEVRPDGGVNWRGNIRTRVPFLPSPLDVKYENDSLQLSVDISRRLRSPLPGFTVNSATLSMTLSPTLSASGDMTFTLGRGASAIATGSVHIGADANGFTGTGRVDARIPGLSESSITINMVNGEWSGSAVLEATQIRIPNVTRARVQLDIDSSGLRPSGDMDITLPRELGMVTLGVSRQASNVVFTGRGRIRVPGLDNEVDVNGRYSNGTLRATASNISFSWRSFTGTLDVTYTQTGDQPGRISGTGTVRIARGNMRGSLEVNLNDAGQISGRGNITYPLNIRGTRIDASAGIIVDANRNVRVEGALRLPQPIELFRSFGSERQLFRFDRSIPIPGLSIGPVGVVAIIEGGLSAGYSFGPGQLRNVVIEAAFDPFAENINPNLSFHCELHIPASAHLTAMIGGGIGVEAGIARVRGTLRINARLGLDAVAGGPLDVRYQDQIFSISARPGVSGALVLGLSLDANARAEAGFGPFTVGTEKTWNLGRRDVTLGRFSVHAPISYSSDSGLQVPGVDDLEWGPIETPDPANILSQLFNGATATERETPT